MGNFTSVNAHGLTEGLVAQMDKKRFAVSTPICARCEKPVYFAERKTSLGRDWHPSCLKCEQCGKVLAPGQHAEHKGTPYCHKPCYGALFGPQMSGYGSNVYSPANFRKSGDHMSPKNNNSSFDQSSEGIKCIFKTTNTSLGPVQLQKNGSPMSARNGMEKRRSLDNSDIASSGYYSNSGSESNSSLTSITESKMDAGYNCVYQSDLDKPRRRPGGMVTRSHSDVGGRLVSPVHQKLRGAELFKRVQSYNEHHQEKRGQTLTYTEEDGNVGVQGPLRIYWGLKKPIILKQYDDVPVVPIPKKRFSVVSDQRDLPSLPEIIDDAKSNMSPGKGYHPPMCGLDDSIISSPDVVMRRQTNIKKSNTVAYRGDRPNKWKRASINGHIYNYDTSVFTPVLGSCTSVTVNNKMTVRQVIKALLDKFKVENEPDEYDLCIVTEQDSERCLRDSDIPLLERLIVGPSDSVKLFIRDRPEQKPVAPSSHIPDDHSPTTEVPPDTEPPLPEEVEQLLNIPEPVLRGLLEKFKRDEEMEVNRLKARYDRFRRRVQQIIQEKKANSTRC